MPHPHDDDRQQRDRQHDLRKHDEGGDHPGPRGPVPARAAVAAAEDRARAHASAPRTEAQDSAAGDDTAAADDSHIALVDGSNVAHSSEGEKARLRNIELVCDKLIEEGLQPIVVTDAALRHQIDETEEYERLIENGKIKQAPAGTDADYFILAFARELDAAIVSNDRFRDRASAFPEARDRAIRYMIVNDEVVLERRTRRR